MNFLTSLVVWAIAGMAFGLLVNIYKAVQHCM